MKWLMKIAILLVATLLLTACGGNRESTTILEEEGTDTPISGRMVHTLEAVGDELQTWEIITYYDREEYFEFYFYESEEEIREWFAGPEPRMLVFQGMTFELVDITADYVITRIFYDISAMANEDLAFLVESGEFDDDSFISLEYTLEDLKRGGAVVVE